ncbi:MAG: PilZ domain-containing protein [Candidatus Caenarcaniphilales bacterium]|nr:PilZ domain-containing protein [Candidatus Caenarcaniphilales bacterium]
MARNLPPSIHQANKPAPEFQSSEITLDVPLLAQVNYAEDCQVKLPVSVRSRSGRYFMKNPVLPPQEWRLTLIIRSIDFPENYPIKLWQNPLDESECWEARVLKRVAQSPHAEVFEISHPEYLRIGNRRSKRVFCLAPVEFRLLSSKLAINGTCIDMSESGLSLKLNKSMLVRLGEQGSINFLKPFDSLPPLNVKVIRQSSNKLDNSTFLGLSFSSNYSDQVSKMIEFISQKQTERKSDIYIAASSMTSPSNEASRIGILKNLADNIFSTLSRQA